MDQGLIAIQEHIPPDLPAFSALYQGQLDLLLIALLCGLSLLLMLLWLLVVWQYMRKVTTHVPESDKRVAVLW
jgi:hypothetical protein